MPQSSMEADAAPVPFHAPWPAPRRVLAAIDTTAPSRWAERVAESLADRFGADLALVHVLDTNTEPADTEARVRAGEAIVAGYPARASAREGRVDRLFRIGVPAEQIVSAATDWHADLVVVGTHGRTGISRLLLGSTAAGVLRRAVCPVLCVGQEPPDPVILGHILIAVDDSDQAGWAARLGAFLAKAEGSRAALVHVVPFPTVYGYTASVDSVSEALRDAGTVFLTQVPWPSGVHKPERLLRQGPAAQEILQAAREWRADLIVLGTHAGRGLPRLLLGSTADAVLRHSACPVLCVRRPPPAVDAGRPDGGEAGGKT